MKLDNRPLLILGDNHGAWSNLFYELGVKSVENCNILSVGDIGMGFSVDEEKNTKFLNERFKGKNINFYSIRGNHDDPSFFRGSKRIALSNFELIEDYTVVEYNGKNIQLIGGAISIDRTGRKEGVSYWEDERVVFEKEKLKRVDTLITHTAPSWCFPQQFNDMVYGWAGEDAYLLEDLTDERAVMDEIFKVCKPHMHFYGHFHSSVTERINGCVHKLLNIDELYELRV